MKIYQVHEYGGCYEDSFDHIIGTYFNRDNAVKFMQDRYKEKEKLQAIVNKCEACTQVSDTKNNCFKNDGEGFCSHAKLCLDDYEDCEYKIKEVEVLDINTLYGNER